jgi:hypothetical protein
MAIADRLRAPSQPARPCAVGRVLEAATDEDRAALVAALDDPAISTATIFRALRDEGHRASYPVVRVHRTGECCCVDR